MGCGVYMACSADGLTWRQREGWAGSGALIMDNSILHGYDPHTRRWVLWQRPRIMPKHRVIGVSFSPDFEDWTFPECVLVPDEDDPPDTQFDQLSTVAASDGGFVGLLAASSAVRADRGVTGIVPQLVCSRDARRWTRVDRGPFLGPKDPPPTWDDGCIIPFNPQVAGDEIFIFYYGKNAGHIWGEPTADGRRVTRSAFGLVKLPRDRWVALTPSAGGDSARRRRHPDHLPDQLLPPGAAPERRRLGRLHRRGVGGLPERPGGARLRPGRLRPGPRRLAGPPGELAREQRPVGRHRHRADASRRWAAPW